MTRGRARRRGSGAPAVVPCERNPDLERRIREYAEVLQTQGHTLGTHGMGEDEFHQSGLFRGAIERVRGQFSATTRDKREFVRLVLNHMQDSGFIASYEATGGASRHDYAVSMPDGRICALALTGCLDGNNTNIFERPDFAQEFVMWSLCTNPGADPRRNAWSGVHTRLSAEIVTRRQQVDGLVVWDWLCGTLSRPCPKLMRDSKPDSRLTTVGRYRVTPACICLMPASVPTITSNPSPEPHRLEAVTFLQALHRCFGGMDDELNSVGVSVSAHGGETMRQTTVSRGGQIIHQSEPTAIRRR